MTREQKNDKLLISMLRDMADRIEERLKKDIAPQLSKPKRTSKKDQRFNDMYKKVSYGK